MKLKSIKRYLILIVLAVILAIFLVKKIEHKKNVNTITKEGVITEIRKLSQLHSVAFDVNTVITSQKDGNWYKLWQDGQKGLFVAHGRVTAGIDLNKIEPEMIKVYYDDKVRNDAGNPMPQIEINLPPSQIFDVVLDDIQVYDWKTGVFGIVDNDPEILKQAQLSGKAEVLQKACQGGIMKMAAANATESITGLFLLTGAKVTVHTANSGQCHL